MAFERIDNPDFSTRIFDEIGNGWMLVSAAKKDGSINTMTASWGTLGVLWGKQVFICFVRPQRYTHEFTEESEYISLSFFGEEYRNALKICGTKSGRDCDKIAESGLTAFLRDGRVGFNEASRIIYGKKLYCGRLDPKCFVDPAIEKWYNGDYHTVYICEIESIEERKQQ